MEMSNNNKPHAALLASPGMGHLIPVMELAKRLLTHHGFTVTVFIVTTDSTTTRSHILHYTSSLPSLNILILPHVDISDKLGPDAPLEARMGLTMFESLPSLRSSILSINPRPSALIVDLFGTLAFPMARDLGMLAYVFITCNAWFTAVTIYTPVIDKQMEDRHVYHHEPLYIPGCKPVPFEDTLEPFLSRDGPMYEGYLKAAKDIISADGILVNTWQDLEPEAVKALIDRDVLGGIPEKAVYFVGPLVRSMEPKPKRHEVLRWLDEQPEESVIYVSFGSGGTLSAAQMAEVAWGLELSRQRFIWVVRPPVEEDVSGSFFEVKGRNEDERMDYLPEGFVERTEKVGRVVLMWAPQAEILGHGSVGGFVTHCGWNSTLESLRNGVGMVAWPLYAEQRMNATVMEEELEVAVRVKGTEGGVVGREEIGEVVRRIMVEEEGKRIRKRAKELKVSGEKSLSQFGSSHHSLCQMTKDLLNYLQAHDIVKSCGA